MCRIGLVSLGCAKNLVDSELILGHLQKAGWSITADPAEADFLIVNTCGFIADAKEESVETILEMASYKRLGACRGLIVTGCLSARYRSELQQEIPEIDVLLGTEDMDQIPKAIEALLNKQDPEQIVKPRRSPYPYHDPQPTRVLATPPGTAYLKIAEGCNHSCTFCIIPTIRGQYRSRTTASLVEEAAELQRQGIQELNLIAQDTAQYGSDSASSRDRLDKLLKQLLALAIPWTRLLYFYPQPGPIIDELLELMLASDHFVPYLDIPLQHVSPAVLTRMARPGAAVGAEDLHRWRAKVPDLVLRTTLMVGFPGETEQDFQQLLRFIDEANLNHVGVFRYSPEEGTPAARMPDQVAEECKQERYEQLMERQQRISSHHNQRCIGSILTVLVEGTSPESDLVLVGRHKGQAPEADGCVYMGMNPVVKAGELVSVRITEAHPYDLVGEIVEGAQHS